MFSVRCASICVYYVAYGLKMQFDYGRIVDFVETVAKLHRFRAETLCMRYPTVGEE